MEEDMDVALGESGVTMSSRTAQEEDLHDGTGSAQARWALRVGARDSDFSAYMSRKMNAILGYLHEDIDNYMKLGPVGYLQASLDEGADAGVTGRFIKLLNVVTDLEVENLLSGVSDKI